MSDDRAQASCEECGESVDVPATSFGRGLVAAFVRFHAEHGKGKKK